MNILLIESELEILLLPISFSGEHSLIEIHVISLVDFHKAIFFDNQIYFASLNFFY